MSTLTAPEPVAAVRSGNRPFWLLLWALYTTQFIGASFLSTGLVGILRDGGTDSTPNIRDRAAGRVSTGAYSCSRWRSTGTMATAVQAASITTAARQPHAS